jgi:hypothetical protein
MNQQQRDVIDYLQEENRVLREQLGPGRVRFTDAHRRRLAAKAKALGRPRPERHRHDCDPGHVAGVAPDVDRQRYDGRARRGRDDSLSWPRSAR